MLGGISPPTARYYSTDRSVDTYVLALALKLLGQNHREKSSALAIYMPGTPYAATTLDFQTSSPDIYTFADHDTIHLYNIIDRRATDPPGIILSEGRRAALLQRFYYYSATYQIQII